MRTLYNKLIRYITGLITGLDGNHLKIWEFEKWVYTEYNVDIAVKLVITVIIGIIFLIIMKKLLDKVFDLCSKKEA